MLVLRVLVVQLDLLPLTRVLLSAFALVHWQKTLLRSISQV